MRRLLRPERAKRGSPPARGATPGCPPRPAASTTSARCASSQTLLAASYRFGPCCPCLHPVRAEEVGVRRISPSRSCLWHQFAGGVDVNLGPHGAVAVAALAVAVRQRGAVVAVVKDIAVRFIRIGPGEGWRGDDHVAALARSEVDPVGGPLDVATRAGRDQGWPSVVNPVVEAAGKQRLGVAADHGERNSRKQKAMLLEAEVR